MSKIVKSSNYTTLEWLECWSIGVMEKAFPGV